MISKNLKLRKKRANMGQIISKEKKQKREGLMSQMKSKAEVLHLIFNHSPWIKYIILLSYFQAPSPSSSPSKAPASPSRQSPPPPPRSLASSLASTSLTQELLTYLRQLDRDSGGGTDREDTLSFVLKVSNNRVLEDALKVLPMTYLVSFVSSFTA